MRRKNLPSGISSLSFGLLIAVIALASSHCSQLSGNTAIGIDRNVSEVKSIDPADTSFADLAGLQRAIGNARVVLLGEQTHGEGGTFLAKTRLIKFLHQQMGFDVLAFESGFYDCTKIWENTRNGGEFANEIKGSLFFMYANSKQMQPLFSYIQSEANSGNPLTVTGFESQHSGAKAIAQLFTDFEKFLKTFHAASVDASWESFTKTAVATFRSREYRPSADEQQQFFTKLVALKKLLAPHEKETATDLLQSAGFWYRVIASIESQTTRYWQLVKGNELSVRDKQMAENLIWLAERVYAGKKIIVWAHNVHIAKQTSTLSFPVAVPEEAGLFFKTLEPMGQTVRNYFKDQAYAIGFTSSEGQFQDYTNGKTMDVPQLIPGSMEERLHNTQYPVAFADLRHAGAQWKKPQLAYFLDFQTMKGNWSEVFDGMFFIRKNFPVDR
ncbi:erythromycin esterase family protein [Pseudoflavitalea sp. G-6-1-2]|uniref:erythromycin esterase family protein n=1 Tax=Pseudoflavitalea sp. G-6-1-2 TaxID=2728841 RepID=UPI00146C096C|nr:erythromycin esterase family protein [Pseudoflavitalea sp. G-6-1-2]NML19559.1 erythromycin esterase family protein [Pseudoflavitalea sp. G-6-1-2]